VFTNGESFLGIAGIVNSIKNGKKSLDDLKKERDALADGDFNSTAKMLGGVTFTAAPNAAPDLTKPFDGGKGLSDAELGAAKKAEEELKASLDRAVGYRKQALDDLQKANEEKLQILRDGYKKDSEDQDKSELERLASLEMYLTAGKNLIDLQQKDAIAAEELEHANQIRIAKEKNGTAAEFESDRKTPQ